MKRALILAYVVVLLWLSAMILYRRLALALVPTQVSGALVYATLAVNVAIALNLLRRWLSPRAR